MNLTKVRSQCFGLIVLLSFEITFVIATTVITGEDDFILKRQKMVTEQLQSRDITDKKVLEVLGKVPREEFVPQRWKAMAYEDSPLPIGHGQTISQPYIVAFMTQAALLKPDDRVLEIGTGSGYQAAVLAELVKEVYTIEILKPLCQQATERLRRLGYHHIKVTCGDGYKGWPQYAPFDVIIVTAAPAKIPERLLGQLKVGGRMVVPIGEFYQELFLITKTEEGMVQKSLLPVRFVPMQGAEDMHL